MENEENKSLIQIAEEMMAELQKIDARRVFDFENFRKKMDLEFQADNEFDSLTKIIDSTVSNAQTSDNPEFFNMKDFRDKMEVEFSNLGFREEHSQGVENILLVRLQAMGDFINTSAAIREVRKNYPFAYITLVVSDRAHDMAEFCPYVNEVIPFHDTAVESNVLDMLSSVGDPFIKDMVELQRINRRLIGKIAFVFDFAV